MRYGILLFVLLMTLLKSSGQVNPEALARLVKASQQSNSESYEVWYNGKSILNEHKGKNDQLLSCHSVAKSIVSLSIGQLIADGKLDSLDTPVYVFYPEWRQGYRKGITVRHLLNHTSGLEYSESAFDDWKSQPDLVRFALSADVVSPPGSQFNYNNKAFMLLMGVVGKASGLRTDKYIEQRLLKPIGIKNYAWEYDKAGDVIGLKCTSAELIKFGQLILNKGSWKGQQLVSEDWIKQSFMPGQPYVKNCGLMWWIIPQSTLYVVDSIFLEQLKSANIKTEIIQKFEQLKGTYRDVNIPTKKLEAVFGTDWEEYLDREFYPYFPGRSRRECSAEIIGYKAEGWLGQYLIIYPDKNLVATRMVKESDEYSSATDEFMDFEKYVYQLIP